MVYGTVGTGANDALGLLGIPGAGIGYTVDSLTGSPLGQLQNLHDGYAETALGRGTGPMERRMLSMPGMLAPHLGILNPMSALGGYGGLYGGGYAQSFDAAPGATNIPIISKLISPRRRMAGRFERHLKQSPAARLRFESGVGGRIAHFGLRNDGRMTVQRFGGGYAPGMLAGMHPGVGSMAGGLFAMENAVMGQAGHIAALQTGGIGAFGAGSMYGNPFMGMMTAGLGHMGGKPAGPGFGPFDNSGPLGGRGFGSWNPLAMPGRINNTNPLYEGAQQSQASSILADPSLTVEDKVTLLLMHVAKKQDKDIERQMQYINSIQQQQSSRGGPGGQPGAGVSPYPMGGPGGQGMMYPSMMGGHGAYAAGPFGGYFPQGNNSPSIDVESMKLKRMIDKRSQMFDILRQIIDKYNETAKGIIGMIGR